MEEPAVSQLSRVFEDKVYEEGDQLMKVNLPDGFFDNFRASIDDFELQKARASQDFEALES